MVEELLELFVDKVDRDLLKAVELKDLKSSDVKHGAEVCLFQSAVDQRGVAFLRRNGLVSETRTIRTPITSLRRQS